MDLAIYQYHSYREFPPPLVFCRFSAECRKKWIFKLLFLDFKAIFERFRSTLEHFLVLLSDKITTKCFKTWLSNLSATHLVAFFFFFLPPLVVFFALIPEFLNDLLWDGFKR